MRLKRVIGSLAAAGTLTAASFAFSGAALAATTVSLNQGDRQAEQGVVNVVATATPDSSYAITHISIGVDGATVKSDTSGASTLSYSWDTTKFAKNGAHTLQANADETLLGLGAVAGPPASTQVTTLINNPPAAPSGVQAKLDGNNNPVVTWSRNPEADLSGYEVFRSVDGGSPVSLGTTTDLGANDTTAPQGKSLSYLVVAVRSSPVFASGITSCNGAAPCAPSLNSPGAGRSAAPLTVPVPPVAVAQGPSSVATADPAHPVTGTTGAAGAPVKAALGFASNGLKPLDGPVLPTKIVQLPAANVVQFAPLLPYSGKIPEVASASNVPQPVQAAGMDGGSTQSSITVPGVGHVKTVDAAKFFATAAFLIVGAIHMIRFARRLTHPVNAAGSVAGASSVSLPRPRQGAPGVFSRSAPLWRLMVSSEPKTPREAGDKRALSAPWRREGPQV